MTDTELRAAITAAPAIKALADKGDDAGAARALASSLPAVVVSHFVTSRGIVDAFADPNEGNTLLDGLEQLAASSTLLERAVRWLEPIAGGIDFGSAAVRGMIDQLTTGGLFTSGQAATLKALAEVPATVTAADVARAWAQFRTGGKVSN